MKILVKNTKWLIVFAYVAGIVIVTPYLPRLVRFASSKWSVAGASYFVLGIEIAIAVVLISLAVFFLAKKRKKAAIFLISISSICFLSFFIYKFLPNPYEFTHLPEYAFLSILIIRVLDKRKIQAKEKVQNSYFLSGMTTGIIGIGDEIYQHFLPQRFFTWYDIFLNILGGILGLLIYWGIKR